MINNRIVLYIYKLFILGYYLILVLDLEERLAMLNAELRDNRNSSEDLAVAPDVVAVGVLEETCHVLKRPLIVSWRDHTRDCFGSFSIGLHGLLGHLILSAAPTYPLSASMR